MSGRATGWAYKHVRTGDPHAKSVLAALADHADQDGRCFPSHQSLADKTELSPSTVKRKLKLLERYGIIQVIRKKNGKFRNQNFYRLRVELAFDLTKPSEITSDTKPEVTVTPGFSDASGNSVNTVSQEGGQKPGVSLTPTKLVGVTQPPTNFDGVTVTPGSEKPEVSLTPGSESQGSLVTSGSKSQRSLVTPEPTTTYHLNTNNEFSGSGEKESQGQKTDPQETITFDIDWVPNDYIFETLDFNFSIPRFFAEDCLIDFRLYHNGRQARHASFEKKFASWVRQDWQKFQKEFNADDAPKPMTSDWLPDDHTVQHLVSEGMTELWILKQVPEFRMYWLERKVGRSNFNFLFTKHCRYHNDRAGQGSTAATGTFDRLADRSWSQ